MGQIERRGKIDRSKLSGEHYMRSLLEQAGGCGLLSEADLESIQLDCLNLLARQAEGWNGGDSSSVRVETAEKLLGSILFTIGLCLKTYPCPDDAAEALRREGAEALFRSGRSRLDKMVGAARLLHAKVVHDLPEIPNAFFRSTATEGIGGFFRRYDPAFGAQEIHITADYPTCAGIRDLAGIEFIRAYLEQIACEAAFLRRFPPENVHRLLCGYQEGYEEMPINLYEPVLAGALGCALTGREVLRLELKPADVAGLEERFRDMERAAVLTELARGAELVGEELRLPGEGARYAMECLPRIAASVETAARMHAMERVFALSCDPQNEPDYTFSAGTPMGDERYRELAEELMACSAGEDKLAILEREVTSFADFSDLLLDGGFSGEELDALLLRINPAELAALVHKYPFWEEPELFELRESEQALCGALERRMKRLTEGQREAIRRAAERMDGE